MLTQPFVTGGVVGSGRMPLPTPVPRAPLPPFQGPEPPDNLPVNTTQPGNLAHPATAEPAVFHRGSMCTDMRVPGLPPVPGGAADAFAGAVVVPRPLLRRRSGAHPDGMGSGRILPRLPVMARIPAASDRASRSSVQTCQRVKQRGFLHVGSRSSDRRGLRPGK